MADFSVEDFIRKHGGYIKDKILAGKGDDSPPSTDQSDDFPLKWEEIGDGNINFVYRVTFGPNGGPPNDGQQPTASFLETLQQLSIEIESLSASGGHIMKTCHSDDSLVIKDKLTTLKASYDSLQTTSLDQYSQLEEALLTLGQFEQAYSDLKEWMVRIWESLNNCDPIPGHSDTISGLGVKNKNIQKELNVRTNNYKSVMKAGRELMKSKGGDDRNILKRKLADMEQEWQGVCQLCQNRQVKLEDALKKVRQFESLVHPFKSWMTKVIPTLDQSDPVHGDIATVHELITSHETFQNELGSHQKNMNAIISSAQSLSNEVLDDPSIISETIKELEQLWKEMCSLSIRRQERLEQAEKVALEFGQEVRNMWSWMDNKIAELDLMSPPADELEQLNYQIQEQEMVKQDVMSSQHHYDKIIQSGRRLHQLCHPRAEPVLNGQLQQLEQKWADLRGKMAARSEALASNMLELHGLQDMLDELSGWVGQAEAVMNEAEGVAVGCDLESVERQLNEHEMFQEEMATHQPNMDALNKTAKRRKSRPSAAQVPAHSSNPDLSKRIGHLYKRWQKLWLRSSERHRQLLEARTRLSDIALARSFDFDAWCKKFIGWIDQQKLRVNDLFRRFDANHDGRLTREEFMKGLKASGLTMNQIEMEKISDNFDRNKNGLIELSEIMIILKGQRGTTHRPFVKKPGPSRQMSDSDKIDLEIKTQVAKCCCHHKFTVTRVGEGQYRFGDSQKLRLVRILRSTVMVRVGGGWEPLQEFLTKNDPCRVAGRTNTELRDNLIIGGAEQSGLAQMEFRRKSQSAILAKNEGMRQVASAGGSGSGHDVITRTLPSGRQETTVTNPRRATGTPTVKVHQTL